MYKDFLDKKQKLKWLSDGMKQALLPDYGPVNQRYGRSRLGKIAKEVGAYTDLMAGTQAGSVKPPAYVLDAVDQSIRQGAFDHYGGGELERELFTYITNRYQRWYGAKLDPATETGTPGTILAPTAVAGSRSILISVPISAVADNWGVIIHSSLTTGFTPSRNTARQAIQAESVATFTWLDFPLTVGVEVFYRFESFSDEGDSTICRRPSP